MGSVGWRTHARRASCEHVVAAGVSRRHSSSGTAASRDNRVCWFLAMGTQSYISNELTHFVGRNKPNNSEKYALLVEILRGGWLQPSYREELGPGFTMLSGGHKRLSTNEAIKSTMLCFCDIPRGQLHVHMQKYSSFGIAFPKEALVRQGANPVHYVARNARNRTVLGVGPQTIGEQFDELNAELQRIRFDLEEYITRIDGSPAFLFKLSPPNTPAGHRLLGRFSALQSEIESLVFAQIKFFTAGLPEDHLQNFYMEREWRLRDGLAFRPEDIARIIIPADFVERFRRDRPEYAHIVDPV